MRRKRRVRRNSSFLAIMFQGCVILMSPRENHTKIVIGVETGYKSLYYTARSKDRLMLQGINEKDQVLFTGYFVIKGELEQFTLESIVKYNFNFCLECDIPLTSKSCILFHDKEAQLRLDGTWEIVHKVTKAGCIKIFFEKHHLRRQSGHKTHKKT